MDGLCRLHRPIFAGGKQAILNSAAFAVNFADLGDGAVDTTFKGSGSSSFTRATVAWTKLASGLWASVASGTARSCYLGADTSPSSYGGYFAESAGTQLVTPTASIRDMTNGAWSATNITAAKTATGIDGISNSASTLTASAGNGKILQTLTAAASSRTYSAFIRRKTGSGTINITQNGGTAWTDVTSQINSTTYTRVSLNASVLNASFGIQIVTSGDAIEVDFNQFEAGTFATSPMASAGAARNADLLNYQVSGNISGTVGTCYLEGTWQTVTGGVDFISTYTGSGGIVLGIFPATISLNDGLSRAPGPTATTPSTTRQKMATKWSGSSCNGYLNGVPGTPATFDGDLSLGTPLAVMYRPSTSANCPNGTIKKLRIWTAALSDSQLSIL